MISHPAALGLVLVAIVAAVHFFHRQAFARGFFKYLPVPLWCYFIPTVLSSFGLLPREHGLYNWMGRILLPACLFLLLIGTHIPSILRLSPKALLAMGSGTLGILVGGLATFPLIAGSDPQAWKGWACLSATWTGGSANMLSMREILDVPGPLFSNLVIVDTLAAYSWMALLVFLSEHQAAMDRWLKAEPIPAPPPLPGPGAPAAGPARPVHAAALLAAAFLAGAAAWSASALFPQIGAFINRFAWMVTLAMALPLALSLTPARRLDAWGAAGLGNFLLSVLLTSIGARADLSALFQAPIYVALGAAWLLAHGLVLWACGRAFRIPSALLAAASQANVGGTVSAPIVASVYNQELAPLGLVLAVLGNIYGTAAALAFARVCKSLADLLQ